MTLDSWSVIMYNLMNTSAYTVFAATFCVAIIFIMSFFLVNLMLAVIMESYISSGSKFAEMLDDDIEREKELLEKRIEMGNKFSIFNRTA
jgi:hypothetical protein